MQAKAEQKAAKRSDEMVSVWWCGAREGSELGSMGAVRLQSWQCKQKWRTPDQKPHLHNVKVVTWYGITSAEMLYFSRELKVPLQKSLLTAEVLALFICIFMSIALSVAGQNLGLVFQSCLFFCHYFTSCLSNLTLLVLLDIASQLRNWSNNFPISDLNMLIETSPGCLAICQYLNVKALSQPHHRGLGVM